MPNNTAVTVIRYRERGMNCASCRSASVAAVMVGDKIHATSCARHLALWARRAEEETGAKR